MINQLLQPAKHKSQTYHHGFGIVLLVVMLLFAGACERGNSTAAKIEGSSVTSYCPRTGDIFDYRSRLKTEYSDGQTITLVQSEKFAYSQTDAIPDKYSYSGDIPGPYILDTTTTDGVVDGYHYMTLDGTVIIGDDLTTFMRVDAQTSSGSDEPEDVSVGDDFTSHEESTLFDSNTAERIGTELIDGIYRVVTEETVTVPAGTFHCVKIDFEIEIVRTEKGVIDTMSTTGSIWYAMEKGFVTKLTGTTEITISEHDLTAITTIERVLTDYELGFIA